jgi:PIN domain nuclease of toxin-antitoxin system
MRLLIDTHALLWSMEDARPLSFAAAAALRDPTNEKIDSIGTFREMSIKFSLGKLQMPEAPDQVMERFEREQIATILPIRAGRLRIMRGLPHHHKDPFDRMIVAQAIADALTLVSSDAALDIYGVRRLW